MISRIQWQSPHMFWLALTVLVIGLAVVLWLYQSQLRVIHSSGGWMLPMLRVGMFGVLAVSLLRPTIVRPVDDRSRRPIMVLVDQSRSMSVVDSSRSTAELVQLAAALRALPEQVRPSNFAELRTLVSDLNHVVDEIERSRSERQYALLAGRGMEAAEAHLKAAQNELTRRVRRLSETAPGDLADAIGKIDREDSASQIAHVLLRIDQLQREADDRLYRSNEQVREICATLAGNSRIELVRRALEGERGLLSRISRERSVQVFGVSDGLKALSSSLDSFEAEAARADFTAALRALRSESEQDHLGAIILFTDGRRIGRTSELPSGMDIPTFVVSSSAPIERDLSINRVWMPSQAFVGQMVRVAIELQAVGCDAEEVEVTVELSNERHSQLVTIREGNAVVRLNFRVMQPGVTPLEIRVSAIPVEVTAENNRVDRVLKVIADPIRVALLGGAATQDYQSLRDVLVRDPGIELLDRVVTSGERAISVEQIEQQDVIILCDLPQSALDARQWDALNRVISQKSAGALIMTADPVIAAGYASNALATVLLPWRPDAVPSSRTWAGESAVFRIVPAHEDVPPIIRFWDESDPNSPRWNELPAIFQFLAMPALRSGVEPLLVERDSRLPVLTRAKLGQGTVLFLGLDEMWRWEQVFAGAGLDRFWGQFVHQLAPAKLVERDVEQDEMEEEMRDVSTDEDALRRLAGIRGEVLTLAEVLSLPERLSQLKVADLQYVETRLWDNPYLFLFVLSCLGLEWALRKRVGLM